MTSPTIKFTKQTLQDIPKGKQAIAVESPNHGFGVVYKVDDGFYFDGDNWDASRETAQQMAEYLYSYNFLYIGIEIL